MNPQDFEHEHNVMISPSAAEKIPFFFLPRINSFLPNQNSTKSNKVIPGIPIPNMLSTSETQNKWSISNSASPIGFRNLCIR